MRKTAIVAVALFVTACSGTSATDPGGGNRTLDGKGEITGKIRLSWWGGEQRIKKTNAVADLFEKAHTGVKVDRETTDFGNYWSKLNVQAAGKNLPCVTQTQARQLNDYTKRNVLLPLDPMLESGAIDASQIPKEILDTGRGPDGKLYMLPYGAAYDTLMVNQTMAQQAGIPLPPEGYDWDWFFDWVEKAQPKLPKGVSASGLRGGLSNYLIAYVNANGQKMFGADGKIGFDKQLLTDYWTKWEKLRAARATLGAAAAAEEPNPPEESFVAQGKVFSDARPGNALTPIQKAADGRGAGHKLMTYPLPSGPGGAGNVIIASGFSIPTNCDNIPTAAAFVNFWTNNAEAAKLFASDNGAVTNKTFLAQQQADQSLPATKRQELGLFQKIAEQKPQAVIYPPGYQDAFEGTFLRMYQDISFGRKSVQQAVDAFFAEANAALGR